MMHSFIMDNFVIIILEQQQFTITNGLFSQVECRGVSVTVISPGYVNTALSVNALAPDGSKHGVVDATTAAGASPHKVLAGHYFQ